MKMIRILFMFALVFGMGNAFGQVKVVTSGDVGIGTTTPTARLHVVGGDMVMNNPGSNATVIGGETGAQRLRLTSNIDVINSRAFFTMWGTETHGAAGENAARAGELAVQCAYYQIAPNKPVGGYAAVAFEVKADGNTHAYGDLFANGVMVGSDMRLKQDVQSFDKGLAEILQIETKQYRYNGKAGTGTTRTQTGVIAQEFAKILPEAVQTFKYDDYENNVHEEYLAVDVNTIQFMLVNAVKEQQKMIKELQAKLDALSK